MIRSGNNFEFHNIFCSSLNRFNFLNRASKTIVRSIANLATKRRWFGNAANKKFEIGHIAIRRFNLFFDQIK